MDKQTFYAATKLAGANAETRSIDFIISSAMVDRAGDTINANGWEFANYLKNPIVLWGHDRYNVEHVVGKASNVRIDASGQVMATATFATADENPVADTVFKLLKGEYLNAVSVGFKPLEWVYTDTGVEFLKQELLEFSVVSIPCHPGALATARTAGIDTAHLAKGLTSMAMQAPNTIEAGRYQAAFKAATGKEFTIAPAPKPDFSKFRRKSDANAAMLALTA